MSRGPDVATMLMRALILSAEAAGCAVAVPESDWTRWSSATFTGARHLLVLEGEDCPALAAWVAGLTDADFRLRGHLVADLVVEGVMRGGGRIAARVEVLTVEDR